MHPGTSSLESVYCLVLTSDFRRSTCMVLKGPITYYHLHNGEHFFNTGLNVKKMLFIEFMSYINTYDVAQQKFILLLW